MDDEQWRDCQLYDSGNETRLLQSSHERAGRGAPGAPHAAAWPGGQMRWVIYKEVGTQYKRSELRKSSVHTSKTGAVSGLRTGAAFSLNEASKASETE